MKPLRIVITAGGTIAPIDDVRAISNGSTGITLSRIAEEALRQGHHVRYLHATRARLPFGGRFARYRERLTLVPFETVDDYAAVLKRTLAKKTDIAFLGAAVSDYAPVPAKGKIRSDAETITITLRRTPKIISQVKSWSRGRIFQVGFKLLSRVSDEELVETAYASGLANHSDLTVANRLEDVRLRKNRVLLVTPERGVTALEGTGVARDIVAFAVRRAATRRYRNDVRIDHSLASRFPKETAAIARACRRLSQERLMPPFLKGARARHGSIAVRVPGGFLITAKASDKTAITSDELVLVRAVDARRARVACSSPMGRDPSLNAGLMARIFDARPDVRAVVHTHAPIPGAPVTPFAEAPGTRAYVESALATLGRGDVATLRTHGSIALGSDIPAALAHVLS